ncbi:glycosyl transferase [Brasilonema octagenarum UFV-E1]|uniref:Glycosyl transferase n=1 Tax=Brasilonema sennae CENA114 TaxID=415709 RepID=A0A856M5R9_9CYAN|nr:glycosyltransferase family 4 protein [Brasilonema sennae]QDL06525.1 glycosyl transferase [Brasilonema sennae CENA114]QDL12896.1 glycosyl transferase [Brasilonema octagenarum UFV-E1]
MKVLQMSTYDSGGAGRAVYRLHQGLHSIGINSQLLVQAKNTDDKTVIAQHTKLEKGIAKLRPSLSRLLLNFYPQRELTDYYLSWLPDRVCPQVKQLNPDILNLHWISNGYLEVETIAKLNKPIVWTLHDMWAFTGGCHYSQNCDRYMNSCGACPQLNSQKQRDLSRWQWQRKARAWQEADITLVSPSSWLAKCAQASSIFRNTRVEVIPNGLDTNKYKPVNKHIARELLNLPQDKQLIVFGAVNATQHKRKGFTLLQAALQDLSKSVWQDRLELVIFGSSQSDNQIDLGFRTHYTGKLADDVSLSLVYSAADVFIAPSIEDNLPNTVMEAIACGTPCIAFHIGGMPDMIEHQKNGYLAQPYKIEDLSYGITWVLENTERYQKLCHHAREKAEQEFTMQIQAQRYLSMYTELLSRANQKR